MFYRLGIDLGETSIGWCILQMNEKGELIGIVDLGVYIFPDGREAKSRTPLSVTRREARGSRRNRDRYLRRRERVISELINTGLWPDNLTERKKLEGIDPYDLRARAIKEEVSLPELGRALFHLSQRRGFKSNRKSDSKENESGKIKQAILSLQEKLKEKGYQTIGELLYQRHLERKTTRVKPISGKEGYEFYPAREMLENEFELIVTCQRSYHSELTAELCEQLKDVIFYQREMLPPTVGKCELEVTESRAPQWHPLVQKFRILQEVNNLDLVKVTKEELSLTAEQKKKIILMLSEDVASLNKQGELLFSKISKKLELPSKRKFNLQSDKRKGLKGDWTTWKLSDESCFGKGWNKLSIERKEELLNLLAKCDNDKTVISFLRSNFGLDELHAQNVAALALPVGYSSLSLKAIRKILPYLEQGKVYSEACTMAGYNHSDHRSGEIFDKLPYYGRVLKSTVIGGKFEGEEPDENADIGSQEIYFGKINNPTVHVGLNQVRKVVNCLIAKYGKPQQVVVELARELKLGVEGTRRLIKKQADNQKDNERIAQELAKVNQPNSYQNRQRYKIWERLAADPTKRCCPFSGKQISVNDLFSGEFEIEHLIPFSRSFDDGINNKVISSREANRFKAEHTPYEAFSSSPKGYQWSDIVARSENLPPEMQWRFTAGAMDKFGDEEGCLARMLTDTQYFARCALQYLEVICEDQSRDRKMVWGIPGQLTAMLRDKWGLNTILSEGNVKDRSSHRHHALDALVVACSSRSLLKKIADAARLYEKSESGEFKQIRANREKLIENMPLPFENFNRDKIKTLIDNMVIAFKPDHGVQGQFHRDTCYGYICPGQKKGMSIYATTKDLRSVVEGSEKDADKKIKEIADVAIRSHLLNLFEGVTDKQERQLLLEKFISETGTKRVRCHLEKSDNVMLPIKDKAGNMYKYYELGNNSRAEIYCPTKGKKAGEWQCEIIPTYYANQKKYVPNWRRVDPHAKLIMRLQIDDMVAYEEVNKETGKTESVIARVKKMTSGKVYFRGHIIAKEEGDKMSWGASAKQMQLKKLRKIFVDPLGKVKDPMVKVEKEAA